jgi:glutathione S-transferase
MTGPWRLHGLKQSYFTGKLEAYLRVKGVPFDFVETNMARFRAYGRETGVFQMPALQTPDGEWLTDTTPILRRFEAERPEPALQPSDPVAAFLSLFLEDAFDEWLWRPALYYRWAFHEDSRLMGRQLGRTIMRGMPLPLGLRAFAIRRRQQRVFLRADGVTRETAPLIEAIYADVLALLDPIFARRPFLFGERPVAADFGLFGPMFRHFFSDPTPAAIMRETAPNVMAWVARLWALTPEQAAAAARPVEAPADLDPLLRLAAQEHLTELAANFEAVIERDTQATFELRGARWTTPVSPYCAACLIALRRLYAALSAADRAVVDIRLGAASEHLKGPILELPAALTPQVGEQPKNHRWA